MQTLNEILDRALQETGKPSDRQLALHMGVAPQTLNHWRMGRSTPDAYALMQLQSILKIDAREILAIIEAERAKTDERKSYWETIKSGFSKSGTLALALALATTLIAASLPYSNDVVNPDNGNVYYVKLAIFWCVIVLLRQFPYSKKLYPKTDKR